MGKIVHESRVLMLCNTHATTGKEQKKLKKKRGSKMKKIIAIILVVSVMAASGSFGLLAQTSDSTLRYEVDEHYVVVIPPVIHVEDDDLAMVPIRATYRLVPNQTLEVSITGGLEDPPPTSNGNIRLTNVLSPLDYMWTELFYGSNILTPASNIAASFSGANGQALVVDAEDSTRVLFSRGVEAQAALLPAGTYTGTVTFGIAVVVN